MPWIPIAAGAAGGIGAGLIGNASASADRDAARAAYEQSVKDYEAIGVPSIEAQKLALQQYQYSGDMSPELQSAVKLGDSQMLGVSTDPTYKQAQLQALAKLGDISDSGGMNLTDQSNLQRIMGNINSDERGHREAILQDAQQHQGYGSGAALAAQLMNQQNSSQNANQVGLQTAGMAQDRALQALMSRGNLGGDIRAQEFSEGSQKARAQDTINAWNAMNSQNVGNSNVGYQNQAQSRNLDARQGIMNRNTDTANYQEQYNKGLQQNDFNNKLALASGKGNARAGQANNYQQNAQQTSQMWGGIGSGIAQGGAAAGQYMNDDKWLEAYKNKG